ncbi:putative calcium-binding protein CML41 [Dichanthelium oligosanthes]|uniref:Putative calcium-binding protein CML41 n=1 Tax=Dichanthelium oligosanthes TaxID=888268 RepID=A0A1E5WDG5_9POAL|nr:putative calcium-binding protein CML41 [Dichanthelium oligosanthes]
MTKRLSSKRSFRLPFMCGQSDVASPRGAAVTRSSSSSFGRGSRSTGSSSSSNSRHCELQRIFQHFDRDNDGKISSAELRAFFVSMGDDMPASCGDGGYMLDFTGFVALMEREGGQEEDLRRAFEVFNAVESAGRITARGLQRVLAQLGDKRSVADCEAMIRAYDVDGDGGLDFHEFQRMMS